MYTCHTTVYFVLVYGFVYEIMAEYQKIRCLLQLPPGCMRDMVLLAQTAEISPSEHVQPKIPRCSQIPALNWVDPCIISWENLNLLLASTAPAVQFLVPAWGSMVHRHGHAKQRSVMVHRNYYYQSIYNS